jgi:enoyl-CoA hydratase/carnithine racemase
MTNSPPKPNNFNIRKDENGICELTINRPNAYNALSIECMHALTKEFEKLSTDTSVNVVVYLDQVVASAPAMI